MDAEHLGLLDVKKEIPAGVYELEVTCRYGTPVPNAEVKVRIHTSIGGVLCRGKTNENGKLEFKMPMDGFVPKFHVESGDYDTRYEVYAEERDDDRYRVALPWKRISA